MKKIINGKLYNPDTAKNLGDWSNTNDYSSFSYCHEVLYVKRTGEYFLYGEGGPMSRYSKSLGDNSWSGGESITPLSFGKARQWAEEHLSADEYAAAFGMPDDNADDVALNVMIAPALMAKLKQAAAERKMSLAEIVREKLAR